VSTGRFRRTRGGAARPDGGADKRRLSGVTLGDALAAATARLAEAGIESARLEAELLLARACDDCARALLYAELDRELTAEQEAAFEANVGRRVRREPLAYILGEWGFRRLTLKTDRRALIPRPETEIVVERALEHIRDEPDPEVLDVGTGTGAIALAIADEHPGARITAIDASADALALAVENRELTGIDGRVRLVEHDLTEGLGRSQFDLVVSNPPYVEPEELPTLQPEVRDWEPHVALVASGATEAVARAATEALRPGGWLVLETAAGTGDRIRGLLDDLGYERVTITPDLAGRDRVVEGRWPTRL
jgi:release factor glutamine methyltransferase